MSSSNGLTRWGFPIVLDPRVPAGAIIPIARGVNIDPAACPMLQCDEVAACGDRCKCPPCNCPNCLTRRARARARHGEADEPTTLF